MSWLDWALAALILGGLAIALHALLRRRRARPRAGRGTVVSKAWLNALSGELAQSLRGDPTMAPTLTLGAYGRQFNVSRRLLQTGPFCGPCRTCGCTQENCSGCVARTGAACWWVEADLCSACVGG